MRVYDGRACCLLFFSQALDNASRSPDVVVRESGGQVIVEWRALTVCLLDEIATALRKKLGKTEQEFPLVKV